MNVIHAVNSCIKDCESVQEFCLHVQSWLTHWQGVLVEIRSLHKNTKVYEGKKYGLTIFLSLNYLCWELPHLEFTLPNFMYLYFFLFYMNILCIHVLPMFHAGNLLNKRTTELVASLSSARWKLSIRFCLLCITANWLLVSFSKVEKCTVFSLSCACLKSQKSTRKSRGEEMRWGVYYLPITIRRRMTASSQLKIFLQVILWLCFEQVLQGE